MKEKITKTPEAIEAEREQIEKMRGEIKALCNKAPPAVLSGSSLRQLSDGSCMEESRRRCIQARHIKGANADEAGRRAHCHASCRARLGSGITLTPNRADSAACLGRLGQRPFFTTVRLCRRGNIEMNCNCINELEKKLADKYSSELGTPANVECKAAGFTFGKSLQVVHKSEFKITANAAGFKKGKSIPMVASFCPFCGTSTKEKAA
jgi:hypothetical protein